MSRQMHKRLDAIRSNSTGGVITLPIYEGESNDEAVAQYEAVHGRFDPDIELRVFIRHFNPRPALAA